jgi:hypothetical protein
LTAEETSVITSRFPATALGLGLLVALGVLTAFALYLLTREGSGWEALVAVWLAAPPVIGVGGAAGYAAGRFFAPGGRSR